MSRRRAATSDNDDRDVWETLAHKDPLWAACTNGKRRVEWRYDEFLATGEREVSWASHLAKEENLYPSRQSLAVDFGCGPGRLTGALKERFHHVVGIDTSQAMLDLARRAHPEDSVRFGKSTKMLENECADLIYSTFVLQHIALDRLDECLSEFARILHPAGLLVFQYPARPRRTLPGIAFSLLPPSALNAIQRNVLHYPGIMPMSWMAPDRVIRRATACGLQIMKHEEGPKYSPNWKDVWYFTQKGTRARSAI